MVSMPLRVKFRGITTRELLLVEGPAGWGEFGAFPEYGDSEACFWLRNALEMGWQGPPTPLRDRIPINGTVPALDAVTQAETIADLVAGFGAVTTFKVKVAEAGQQLADDIFRVSLVHQLAPQALIRVDANAAWTVEEALTALPQIVEAAGGVQHFDYAEQPCATVAELVELRRQLDPTIRLAADESVRRAVDPREVLQAPAVEQVVLKSAPLGGPRQMAAVLKGATQRVTVSSALDSAVGMNAGIAVAAILPEISACGLGTGNFFDHDLCAPHLIIDGYMPYRMAVPDADRLAEFQASPARENWWRERLTRCYDYLSAADLSVN